MCSVDSIERGRKAWCEAEPSLNKTNLVILVIAAYKSSGDAFMLEFVAFVVAAVRLGARRSGRDILDSELPFGGIKTTAGLCLVLLFSASSLK